MIIGNNGSAYHLVDGLYYLQHLVVGDFSISINIVQFKCPVEFVLHLASASDTESYDKLLEIDSSRLI